jgi:hypothetical protein
MPPPVSSAAVGDRHDAAGNTPFGGMGGAKFKGNTDADRA